jgi:hypothetical protein
VNRLPKIRFTLAVRVLGAVAVAVVALVAVSVIEIIHSDTKSLVYWPVHAQTLRESFTILSQRHSNECGLRPESLDSIGAGGRLQGSCCTPMEFSHYVEQIRGLAKYTAVREIPRNPYDVSVGLAKRLTAYSEGIKLTSEQEFLYRRAMKLAREHGPCCCHCWRWTAFEGQAKYLIARRGYGSRQIAKVWDIENGCGGA